jgi:hypothetical protein
MGQSARPKISNANKPFFCLNPNKQGTREHCAKAPLVWQITDSFRNQHSIPAVADKMVRRETKNKLLVHHQFIASLTSLFCSTNHGAGRSHHGRLNFQLGAKPSAACGTWGRTALFLHKRFRPAGKCRHHLCHSCCLGFAPCQPHGNLSRSRGHCPALSRQWWLSLSHVQSRWSSAAALPRLGWFQAVVGYQDRCATAASLESQFQL